MKEETFKTIDELVEKKFPGASYEELPFSPVTTYILTSGESSDVAYECPKCGTVLGMYEESAPYAESSHSEKADPRKFSELSKEEQKKAFENALDEIGRETLQGVTKRPAKTKTNYHCRICKEHLGSQEERDEECC